jgi:hypothetical protein
MFGWVVCLLGDIQNGSKYFDRKTFDRQTFGRLTLVVQSVHSGASLW